MYITRDDAIQALYEVINSGIIDRELTGKLEDIATCIDAEDDSIHIWGAEDDAEELFTAYREDLLTEKLRERLFKIRNKYIFVPSLYERTVRNDETTGG